MISGALIVVFFIAGVVAITTALLLTGPNRSSRAPTFPVTRRDRPTSRVFTSGSSSPYAHDRSLDYLPIYYGGGDISSSDSSSSYGGSDCSSDSSSSDSSGGDGGCSSD